MTLPFPARVIITRNTRKKERKSSMRVRRSYLENIVKWRLAMSISFPGTEISSSAIETTGETLVGRDHMILLSKLRMKTSITVY